jgi:type VI secretion system secreted protein Hcp
MRIFSTTIFFVLALLLLPSAALAQAKKPIVQFPARGQAPVAWIEIEGFDGKMSVAEYSLELSQPSARGGRTGGRANFGQFQFTKPLDENSPDLAIHLANGKHIPKAEFIYRESGFSYTIEMKNVVVSAVKLTGGKQAREQVFLSYSHIKWQYQGKGKSAIDRSWNLQSNRQD